VRNGRDIVIKEFAAWVRARFGVRLRELVLFGSVARGEAHEESDVDVAIIVDEITSAETREITDATGDVMTQHGVLIAPLVMSSARMLELRSRERLLAKELARDGIAL
jgi:uncharacterized protein